MGTSKYFTFKGSKFVFTVIIAWIGLLFLVPYLFKIESDATLTGALFLYAVLLAFLHLIHRKKYAHRGIMGLTAGLALLLIGGTLFIGSLGSEGTNPLTSEPFTTEKLWEFDARSEGFSLVGAGLGGIFIIVALHYWTQNIYWSGRR